jgi:hypothetical protein
VYVIYTVHSTPSGVAITFHGFSGSILYDTVDGIPSHTIQVVSWGLCWLHTNDAHTPYEGLSFPQLITGSFYYMSRF